MADRQTPAPPSSELWGAEGEWVRLHPGATASQDPAELGEAKELTHRALEDSLGGARTGPVSWSVWSNRDAEAVIAYLDDGDDKWNGLRSFCAEHPAGLLVVASAPCVLPQDVPSN